LKIVRGQPTSFGELFQGGDKFLAALGYFLLIFVPVSIAFLLLIIPGVFLVMYFWPSYTLIVDEKTSVFGILVLGGMLCYVGLFFAISFVSVLWATAYLMMTGEIR
jgi:hypothetical protein